MKYYLLKCEVESKDLNEKSFGILMVDNNKHREYVCNISDYAEEISRLVECLNSYNVEFHQAREIIEDFKFNSK